MAQVYVVIFKRINIRFNKNFLEGSTPCTCDYCMAGKPIPKKYKLQRESSQAGNQYMTLLVIIKKIFIQIKLKKKAKD